jgi:hypothetical protein
MYVYAFASLIYHISWVPVLHLDLQVPDEPWSAVCLTISSSPFPFLPGYVGNNFQVVWGFLGFKGWELTKGRIYTFF